MEKFTRANLKVLTKDIQEAMKSVALKHDIAIGTGSGRFEPDGTEFSVKLECFTKSTEAEANGVKPTHSKYFNDYVKYADGFGLEKELYGKTFTMGGHTYKFVGIAPRSTKRPVIAERVGNKGLYKFTVADVKRLM